MEHELSTVVMEDQMDCSTTGIKHAMSEVHRQEKRGLVLGRRGAVMGFGDTSSPFHPAKQFGNPHQALLRAK
jgi:hypothetical protein